MHGEAKNSASSTPTTLEYPRIWVYGLLSAVQYAWDIYASLPLGKFSFGTLYEEDGSVFVSLVIAVFWFATVALQWKGYLKSMAWLVPFLLYSVITIAIRLPHRFEATVWTMHTDGLLAVWLLRGLLIKKSNNQENSTSSIEEEDVLCEAIQGMFSWYYFASGFWKLNTHFLDPDASCATMYFVELVSLYVRPFIASSPDTLVSIARFSKQIAPVSALIIELCMGGWQVVGCCGGPSYRKQFRQWAKRGILLALFFHLLVCIMPQPNDIANFALICGARVIVYASARGCVAAIAVARRWAATFLVTGLAAVAVLWDDTWTPNTWAFVVYIPIMLFVVYAVLVDDEGPTIDGVRAETLVKIVQRRNNLAIVGGTIAFLYCFGGIITGLQEESTPNMFANLKVHGGSNHLLLPTGLLFHLFGDYPDSHPFGGGEVRIEATTSNWIQSVYPNDLSMLSAPQHRELLEAVGHPAPFYFNPGLSRVLGIMPPQEQFIPYTVPALELKRLLREAKERDRSFSLTYAQLPGTRGDEAWRRFATRRRCNLQVRDGAVVRCRCVNSDGASAQCGPDDLPMLPDDHAWFLRRISLYNAYPIVPIQNGVMPKSIACFGP